MEKEKKRKVRVDESNPSIQRIKEKCIDCGVCFKTCEEVVGINHEYEAKKRALCINCGQCVLTCPTGALTCKYEYKTVLNLVKDSGKKVAISVTPAVRSSICEELGFEIGTPLESMLPTILRAIGFDYVFDVTFGADVCIMEEASELLNRIKRKGNLPMFTSCCPSWVKYAGLFHRELLPNLSTTKSPIGIQSTLIKNYYREMTGIEDDIISIVVAPCTSKKYEIIDSDTDYIITTRELSMMIKECDIDIMGLKPSSFDPVLGKGSRAGVIFGRSGGVMEAALSTAYYLETGKEPKEGMFHLDITDPITRATYKLGDYYINVAVVYGMKNVEEFLNDLGDVDFVEVMNCTMGCVGGGGQPLGTNADQGTRREARAKGLNEDRNMYKYSYQNKEIEELYRSYLINPLSEKSEELLHTKHKDLSNLINKKDNK